VSFKLFGSEFREDSDGPKHVAARYGETYINIVLTHYAPNYYMGRFINMLPQQTPY
jgi:hypothetical protein